jgi:osmotically-inducible protein OsmY
VGYGAPGYGAGQGYGAGPSHGHESDPRDESRGFGSYSYNRGFGEQDDTGYGSEYGAFARQGHHGQEGYGQSQRGQGGQREWRTRGSAGQGYGAQGYSAGSRDYRSQGYGFGSQAGLQRSEAGREGRSYRGVGPRNYTRSDERIREDLNERLTDAHDIDASGISVEVSNGVVTLTGTVHERWMKHRAEDLADGCSGVRDVRNQLQVQSRGTQSHGAGQQSGMSQGTHGSSGFGGSSSAYAGTGSTGTGSGSVQGSGVQAGGSGSGASSQGTGTQTGNGGSRSTSASTGARASGLSSSASQSGSSTGSQSGSHGSAGSGSTSHNA